MQIITVMPKDYKHIDSGSFGHVYKSILNGSIMKKARSDRIAREMIKHEAAILRQLSHPNVVSFCHFANDCMVLEDAGVALVEAVGDNNMAGHITSILQQMLWGVEYLHRSRVAQCVIREALGHGV